MNYCIDLFEQQVIKNYLNKFRQIEQIRKKYSANRTEELIEANIQNFEYSKVLRDEFDERRGGISKNSEKIQDDERKVESQVKDEQW
jgi:DNA-binding protein H-NS